VREGVREWWVLGGGVHRHVHAHVLVVDRRRRRHRVVREHVDVVQLAPVGLLGDDLRGGLRVSGLRV
jgi:hypothetical protein